MHQLSSPHRRIRLDQLPTPIQGNGVERFEFQSCSSHWQQCQPNDLFVAINRPDQDGHLEVGQAIARGAGAVLAERLIPTVDVPVFVTDDTREAFGHICHELSGMPSQGLQTIGVAGTSGKSLVCHMLHQVLREVGASPFVAPTTQWAKAASITDEGLSSPQIAAGLSDSLACGFDHVLCEVHSHDLARRVWSGTQLDVGVLTGISADFEGRHGTFANYGRALERITDLLKDTGLMIVNADDRNLRELLDHLPYPALSYGIEEEAEIRAEVLEETRFGQTIMLHAGGDSTPVCLPRPGRHWVLNALAATTTALALGIDLTVIQRGLESVRPPAASLEVLQQQRTAAQVVLDRGIFPDRLRAALAAMKRTGSGRLWVVAEISSRLTEAHRASLGALLERYAHRAALAADRSFGSEQLIAIHDVLDGYEHPGRDWVSPDAQAGLEWALQHAGAGDTILIAAESSPWTQALPAWMRIGSNPTDQASFAWPSGTRSTGHDSEMEAMPRILRIDDYRN